MAHGRPALRATAAVAVGAFALHQLRYTVGYGSAASEALTAHGHGYLTVVTPLIALVVAVAAGQFLAQLARARGGGRNAPGAACLGRVWAAAAAILFSTYAGQELLEGALSAGHPAGVAAVLGGGGWWALPLAAVVGLVVALILRGADALVARRAAARRSPGRRCARSPRALTAPDLAVGSVLAQHLAGRAPPPASA